MAQIQSLSPGAVLECTLVVGLVQPVTMPQKRDSHFKGQSSGKHQQKPGAASSKGWRSCTKPVLSGPPQLDSDLMRLGLLDLVPGRPEQTLPELPLPADCSIDVCCTCRARWRASCRSPLSRRLLDFAACVWGPVGASEEAAGGLQVCSQVEGQDPLPGHRAMWQGGPAAGMSALLSSTVHKLQPCAQVNKGDMLAYLEQQCPTPAHIAAFVFARHAQCSRLVRTLVPLMSSRSC